MKTIALVSDVNFNCTPHRTRSVLHYIHHSLSAVRETLVPIESDAKHINVVSDKMQGLVLLK
jgi:hypothetical protein